MLRLITCFTLAICAAQVAFAQNYTIKGSIRNTENGGISTATVSLLKAADSSWVRSEYTDDSGSFTIGNTPAGSYILNVAALNYKTVFQPVVLDEDKTVAVTLQGQSSTLKEVTVSSRKPFIENGLGKTIVNVDASVLTAGTNVLELLKKSPGVTVDGNNNISLQGKKGVLILIDGRETYLTGDQLSDYLKTLSSDHVAQLELITQPSAKYDAAGVAGIINIKTKKNTSTGFNGTATASYKQGFYASNSENVLLNYKRKKLNLTANISQLNATGWQRANNNRTFIDAPAQVSTSLIYEAVDAKEIFANSQLKLGADYNLNDKVTFGGAITGVYHPNHEVSNSITNVDDLTTNSVINSVAVTPDHFLRQNLLANAYLNYDMNKQTNMNIDVNFLDYNKTMQQSSDNKDYDARGQQVDELYLQGNLPSSTKVFNIKDDFTTVLNKDIKLEAGFKSSLAKINDNAGYSLLQNNVWVPDTTRSNHFLYTENINALYASAHKSFGKKWETQAGLRAEQTNTDGTQLTGDKHFTNSRLALFPTAFASYKLDDKNQFEVNFGRRIERPGYQLLNPFIDYVDQYNYRTGNPELKPQYSDYAEIKHSYNNELTTNLHFTHTTDIISTVLKTDSATQATINTEDNIDAADEVGLSISFNKQLCKWWQLSASASVYYMSITGNETGRKVTASGGGDYVSVDTQFTLGKGWTAEGRYYFIGRSIESLMVTDLPTQGMDFGVAKKILHDTATIKLDVSDPFNINGYGEQFVADNVNALYNFKWHSRDCRMTFTYNFGKKYDTKQHNNDISDDTRRM